MGIIKKEYENIFIGVCILFAIGIFALDYFDEGNSSKVSASNSQGKYTLEQLQVALTGKSEQEIISLIGRPYSTDSSPQLIYNNDSESFMYNQFFGEKLSEWKYWGDSRVLFNPITDKYVSFSIFFVDGKVYGIHSYSI